MKKKKEYKKNYFLKIYQQCKLDQLFDILKLFKKFDITSQTHREIKCGKLKSCGTCGQTDRLTDVLNEKSNLNYHLMGMNNIVRGKPFANLENSLLLP